jgi:hypothetical protein
MLHTWMDIFTWKIKEATEDSGQEIGWYDRTGTHAIRMNKTHGIHVADTNSLADYSRLLVRTRVEQMEATHEQFIWFIYSSKALLTVVYHAEALCSDHRILARSLIRKV